MTSEYDALTLSDEYDDNVALFDSKEISDYDREVIVAYLNSKNSLNIIPVIFYV